MHSIANMVGNRVSGVERWMSKTESHISNDILRGWSPVDIPDLSGAWRNGAAPHTTRTSGVIDADSSGTICPLAVLLCTMQARLQWSQAPTVGLGTRPPASWPKMVPRCVPSKPLRVYHPSHNEEPNVL